MGPCCSSAETQVCHRSYIIAATLSPECCMLSGEATNTNFIVFGLTHSGLEPTNNRTRVEHANHCTTDAIHLKKSCNNSNISIYMTYLQKKIMLKMSKVILSDDSRTRVRAIHLPKDIQHCRGTCP